MKNDTKKFLSHLSKILIILIVNLVFVVHVFAQNPVPCTSPNVPAGCGTAVIDNTGSGGPAVIEPSTPPATTGVNVNTGIQNPIAGIEDIPQLIQKILEFVLIVGVPIVALAIIYSGFLFVTAQGNSEKLTTAKKTLLYTLVGAALLLGCLVITKAIQGTVEEINQTS